MRSKRKKKSKKKKDGTKRISSPRKSQLNHQVYLDPKFMQSAFDESENRRLSAFGPNDTREAADALIELRYNPRVDIYK